MSEVSRGFELCERLTAKLQRLKQAQDQGEQHCLWIGCNELARQLFGVTLQGAVNTATTAGELKAVADRCIVTHGLVKAEAESRLGMLSRGSPAMETR